MVVYSGITIQIRHYTIHISTTFYTNTPITTTYTHIIHIQLPTIHTIPYHPIQHPIPYYSTHYTHYYTPPPFPPLPAHATRLQTNHCLPVSGGQTASSPWSSWSPWSNSAFKPSETLAAWSVVRGPSIGCSPLIHSNSPHSPLTTHHSPRLTPPPPPPKRNRSDLQQQNDNPRHLLLPKKNRRRSPSFAPRLASFFDPLKQSPKYPSAASFVSSPIPTTKQNASRSPLPYELNCSQKFNHPTTTLL